MRNNKSEPWMEVETMSDEKFKHLVVTCELYLQLLFFKLDSFPQDLSTSDYNMLPESISDLTLVVHS